ncbi:MAG: stage II sporulation protein E [Bacillota bacterium]|nr:stage II sporulation protein E [Bacillota bacterium]
MWGKSDIYPYHRKGLEVVKDKHNPPEPIKINRLKEMFSDIALDVNSLLLMGLGFLLARAALLGELLPFGIALIGTAAVVKKKLYVILLAVVGGTLTVQTGVSLYLTLAAIGLVAALFELYHHVMARHWLIPSAVIFTVNFVIKAVGFIFLEAEIYFWVMTLVESLLAGGVAVLLIFTFNNLAERKFAWDRLTPEEMASILVICLGLVLGLAELSVWGLSLKTILSKLAILIGALLYGPGVAAIVGAIIGVIPGTGGMMAPALAGILAFSGVLAGAFRQLKKLGVIIGFVLGNLIFTVYLADQLAILYYLGESLLAGLILLLIPTGVINQFVGDEEQKYIAGQSDDKPVTDNTGLIKRRVKELSQIFREVAHTFEETIDSKEVDTSHQLIVENVRNRLCLQCRSYNSCWTCYGTETAEIMNEMIDKIGRKGNIMQEDLPVSFQSYCSQPKEFCLALVCAYDTWQVNNYWYNTSYESNKMIPSQLKGISNIMDNLANQVSHGENKLGQWEKEFKFLAQGKGLALKSVKFLEDPIEGVEIQVNQTNCGGSLDCTDAVAAIGSDLIGKQMKIKKLKCDYNKSSGSCQYKLRPALQFKVTVGKAQATKTGSPISGDTYSVMPLTEGKFGLILSDGMGTGQRAKLESNTTIALLEHLLESGFDREVAINTINSILVLRSREDTFATLDMAIVDLYSGMLENTKIGAVPSFLKRGSHVGIIRASSLPIGILDRVESVTIEEQLQVGDIIVLVTDGVLEADSKLVHKEKWVQELLAKLSTDDPQEIAEHILFQARVLAADKNKDDMTVLVGRIDSRLH